MPDAILTHTLMPGLDAETVKSIAAEKEDVTLKREKKERELRDLYEARKTLGKFSVGG